MTKAMFPATLCLVLFVAKFVRWLLSLFMYGIVMAEALVQFAIMLINELIRKLEPKTAILDTRKVPSETSDPHTTVGQSRTVGTTRRVIPPAETRPTVDPSTVNVSSSIQTDKIEADGSVKRCKENIDAIFNTMDERNLLTKCKEIKKIIFETKEKCLPWLARYIITKRISVESSHHSMCLKLLNILNNEILTELITLETESDIKALLSKDEESPICRKTLNNLGSWYGMMTLAKNKPIGKTFEDLKTLLIKAYQEEKLTYTLPLVTRILETCANSTVCRIRFVLIDLISDNLLV
ncbi:CCR4-NOT transcription complex subunit 1, CAF1-binding domain [Cinara cedri]|uniref:CCR4-NOT transcription complex subunit 1, CAF1-binding domain n=1 Tax=Cinara cedri TaxID=506608 RepID=A0A5E4M7Y5_9HEMI|nr:CCR4-NOT transcription complex subunit 1, CAF1-binding domain [Cinara cedri]